VIAGVAARLGDVLAAMPRTAPAYGLIHGDLHAGNVHVDGRSFTFFDFDHCAVGWRAYDLAPARMSLDDAQWDALLAGYAAVRDLPPGIDHLADLVLMRYLWDVGDMLAMETVWQTTRFSDKFRGQIHEFAQSLSGRDAKGKVSS
jgi:Ser/Thr protein kinase RdoA (MazF antagonist)